MATAPHQLIGAPKSEQREAHIPLLKANQKKKGYGIIEASTHTFTQNMREKNHHIDDDDNDDDGKINS